MKNLKKIKTVLLLFTIILFISCTKNDSTPQTPPDYADEFVGLWKFDNTGNQPDALFFGANGEAFQIFYGDLNTVSISPADFNTYEFKNNQVSYFLFGGQPISYDGGNTFAFPGGTMTKDNSVNNLDDVIETLVISSDKNVDVTTFFSGDNFNNLDGFDDHLLIPNPSAAEGRYIRFKKSDLSFVEEVTGIGQTATSIGVYDTNPFELLSILEGNNKFRTYQPFNPAFHPPAVDDIPFTPNRYRCHAVTNGSGRDFISYNRNTKSFNYHDVNILNEQQGVSSFAFYDVPSSRLRIRGMGYAKGKSKLIVCDSYNLHIFNIGFNAAGDDVSAFEHERSISIVPLRLTNEDYFGRIQGVYYDSNETLYMVINNGGIIKLVKILFEF